MAYQDRILIVDDDFQTASYIAELLTAQGYETAWAFDGEEALALLQRLEGLRTALLAIPDQEVPGIRHARYGVVSPDGMRWKVLPPSVDFDMPPARVKTVFSSDGSAKTSE